MAALNPERREPRWPRRLWAWAFAPWLSIHDYRIVRLWPGLRFYWLVGKRVLVDDRLAVCVRASERRESVKVVYYKPPIYSPPRGA